MHIPCILNLQRMVWAQEKIPSATRKDFWVSQRRKARINGSRKTTGTIIIIMRRYGACGNYSTLQHPSYDKPPEG